MSVELLPVEALERLSRQEGVDVRPILLRVLTDLFVQKAHHAPEEIQRYQELALPLLDVVDVDTRVVVARKLAEDERAPDAVLRRLLDDEFSVAAPIIARSVKAPRQMLLSLAFDGDALQACAVARRPDIDNDMIRILAHHPDDRVLETLAANAAVAPGEQTLAALVRRAIASPSLAAALLQRRDVDMAALSPLYLAADPEQRGAIRLALGARPPRPSAGLRIRSIDAADIGMVEAATESGARSLMAEALGDVLGVAPAAAAMLAAEPSGEPFVLMLRAVGVERDQIARALLIGQPEIAQSVQRFFELVDIAEATPRAVASELIAALLGQEHAAPQARHEPLFDPSGVSERSGAARAVPGHRRPMARPGETVRQRG